MTEPKPPTIGHARLNSDAYASEVDYRENRRCTDQFNRALRGHAAGPFYRRQRDLAKINWYLLALAAVVGAIIAVGTMIALYEVGQSAVRAQAAMHGGSQ